MTQQKERVVTIPTTNAQNLRKVIEDASNLGEATVVRGTTENIFAFADLPAGTKLTRKKIYGHVKPNFDGHDWTKTLSNPIDEQLMEEKEICGLHDLHQSHFVQIPLQNNLNTKYLAKDITGPTFANETVVNAQSYMGDAYNKHNCNYVATVYGQSVMGDDFDKFAQNNGVGLFLLEDEYDWTIEEIPGLMSNKLCIWGQLCPHPWHFNPLQGNTVIAIKSGIVLWFLVHQRMKQKFIDFYYQWVDEVCIYIIISYMSFIIIFTFIHEQKSNCMQFLASGKYFILPQHLLEAGISVFWYIQTPHELLIIPSGWISQSIATTPNTITNSINFIPNTFPSVTRATKCIDDQESHLGQQCGLCDADDEEVSLAIYNDQDVRDRLELARKQLQIMYDCKTSNDNDNPENHPYVPDFPILRPNSNTKLPPVAQPQIPPLPTPDSEKWLAARRESMKTWMHEFATGRRPLFPLPAPPQFQEWDFGANDTTSQQNKQKKRQKKKEQNSRKKRTKKPSAPALQNEVNADSNNDHNHNRNRNADEEPQRNDDPQHNDDPQRNDDQQRNDPQRNDDQHGPTESDENALAWMDDSGESDDNDVCNDDGNGAMQQDEEEPEENHGNNSNSNNNPYEGRYWKDCEDGVNKMVGYRVTEVVVPTATFCQPPLPPPPHPPPTQLISIHPLPLMECNRSVEGSIGLVVVVVVEWLVVVG